MALDSLAEQDGLCLQYIYLIELLALYRHNLPI